MLLMGERLYINDDWKFSPDFSEEMLKADFSDNDMALVRLPHTVQYIHQYPAQRKSHCP